MSFDEAINAYFVTTGSPITSKDGQPLSDFETALSYLRNHIPEDHIYHIKDSEGYPLIASGQLTKKDVFIFDRFEGDFFKQLQLTKSLIVGPRCLTVCLLKCEPIPLGISPVYTTAMRNLQISATGISLQEKERLRELIQWMGGHYFQNLGRSTTHLISNTIKSTKYEHATLNGIPVMHVDWVQRVWERSCVEDVAATAEEFDRYKLPIFFGTNITCTGLENDKKNEVMRLVNENGGTFHRAFRSQLVDIVITEKDKTNTEKYRAAVRFKKDILLPEWIFDSAQQGYALPTKKYQVKSLKVSTPTKTDQSIADFIATDSTQLSEISHISSAGRKRGGEGVNDTICSLNETPRQSIFARPAPVATATSKLLQMESLKKGDTSTHYRLIYEEICPKQAKKAGNFLDGCCIYLSGFRMDEKEKLNRILNVGGATRYDVVNEKITHIIVGQLEDSEFRAWKRNDLLSAVHILRLDWLLESIKLKQPASETVHRISLPTSREPDAPSPSSKRTLRSMNHSFKQPDVPTKKKLFDKDAMERDAVVTDVAILKPLASSTERPHVEEDEEEELNLIAQYSRENTPVALPMPPPRATSGSASGNTPTNLNATSICRAPIEPAPSTTSAPVLFKEQTQGAVTIDYENLDFFCGVCVYVDKEHFPIDFYSQMISECEAAQGHVVSECFRDPVDFAIVSFERTLNEKRLPVKARQIITELYVESCMKQNKLVPVEYYHKHIPHTADALPLLNMTIVISTYTGLERDFIDSIAQLLGAKVNKSYVRKERPLLVCPVAEGSKYQGAINWGYPVVTSDWLVQCAVRGEKLSYRPFLVGNCVKDFPTVSRENSSSDSPLAGLGVQLVHVDVENQPGVSSSGAAADRLSVDFTPLRNKRVSELAGPAKNVRYSVSPDSPHTPPNNYARPSYNFDFMEGILAEIEDEAERECLREVIIEMRNNQTPELERIRRQACTPINRKMPTPKGIPEFCTTPEFEKRMADEFEKRWRLPTKKLKPDTPIDEIRQRVMQATCKHFGILLNDLNDEFEAPTSSKKAAEMSASSNAGRMDTPTLQQMTTRNSGVTPRNIFPHNTSKAGSSRSSDTFVPSTQSPNANDRQESPSTSGMGQRASVMGRSTINFDKISFEDTADSAATSTSNVGKPVASPELKQITDYLKTSESRRRMALRGGQQKCTTTDMMMETEGHCVQPFESEQIGGGSEDMVGWRDPAEFGMERRSKGVCSMQHKGTPRFSISCSEEVRDEIISKIILLGGEICENLVNYDATCTHFVCERPSRAEKMLGCMSSGKWVLSLKYIEESHAKDAFIDEELYEWGNCKALNLPKLKPDEQAIALAAHRWRRDLSSSTNDKSNGAFDGFQVILRLSDKNRDAIKTVIKAGKGKILEVESPYSVGGIAQTATHCFVDMKKMPIGQEDYDFLRAHGVGVFTQMYINAYLMNGKGEDFSKYEVKK